MPEITLTKTKPLKRTMRLRMEHVQLLPDLFFYERQMEQGFTTDGEDFIEQTFVHPHCMAMHEVPTYPFGMTPFYMSRENYTERGFLNAEGMEALKAASWKPLKDVPRIKLFVITPHDAERARKEGPDITESISRNAVMADWKNGEIDPARDLYYRGHGGHYYVRLDGTPLATALQVYLFTKEVRHEPEYGCYGCYDETRLAAHLNMMQQEKRVSFSEDGWYFRVRWLPRDQAEFDKVWNAAQQTAPDQNGPKDLRNTLIALDILGIEQFKCEPPKPVRARIVDEFKTRLFRIEKSDGTQRLVFAKTIKSAVSIAASTGFVNEDGKPMRTTDISDDTVSSPHKAMRAGLIGIANYHSGIDHGWEATYRGRVTRICDNDQTSTTP